jgi:hypothetical protein
MRTNEGSQIIVGRMQHGRRGNSIGETFVGRGYFIDSSNLDQIIRENNYERVPGANVQVGDVLVRGGTAITAFGEEQGTAERITRVTNVGGIIRVDYTNGRESSSGVDLASLLRGPDHSRLYRQAGEARSVPNNGSDRNRERLTLDNWSMVMGSGGPGSRHGPPTGVMRRADPYRFYRSPRGDGDPRTQSHLFPNLQSGGYTRVDSGWWNTPYYMRWRG